jgi:Sulfotransferase family
MNCDKKSIYNYLVAKLGAGEFNYAYNLSLKNNYLYIENAKSACTTIKHNLGVLEFSDAGIGDDLPRKYLDNVHANVIGTPFVKPFMLGEKVFNELIADGHLTIFTAVRNPFTRILSAYLDKVTRKLPESIEIYEYLESPISTDLSFKDFLKAIAAMKNDGRVLEKHWREQSLQCGSGLLSLSAVLKMENLDVGFGNLCREYEWNVDELEIQASHSTAAADKMPDHYDDECIEIVVNLFGEDFEQFSYSTDLKEA